jgi:hypothetical protein
MATETDIVDADIKVDEALWRSSILPEGVLDDWLALDGAEVVMGHAVAVVRIEDAQHDLVAPATGRLQILTRPNAVIEPGTLIGRIVAV